MSRRGVGLALVVLGVVMVMSALLLITMFEKREAAAGYNSDMLMQEFIRNENAAPAVPAVSVEPEAEPEDGEESLPVPEMATEDYYGLAMLGVIRVPDCGIELPVLDNWTMATLDYGPCRYDGNVHSGDLVIMGHNYTTHFKPLKKVEVGAAVEFESVDGTVWYYTVDSIDSVHRDEPAKLYSEHELILFTCEEYGVYRFVARCSAAEAPEAAR